MTLFKTKQSWKPCFLLTTLFLYIYIFSNSMDFVRVFYIFFLLNFFFNASSLVYFCILLSHCIWFFLLFKDVLCTLFYWLLKILLNFVITIFKWLWNLLTFFQLIWQFGLFNFFYWKYWLVFQVIYEFLCNFQFTDDTDFFYLQFSLFYRKTLHVGDEVIKFF